MTYNGIRTQTIVISEIALQGTSKQIAWAERIRTTGLVAIGQWLEDFERQCSQHNSPADQVEPARALYHGLRDKVAAQTSAAWWIDRRGAGAQTLLKAVQP